MEEKFNQIIYNYRFAIGGVLILIILSGLSLIGWDFYEKDKTVQKQEIIRLKLENQTLREQLSNISVGKIEAKLLT